jgi:hemolysin activation/secretion protein
VQGASRHWDAFRFGLDANYSFGRGWNSSAVCAARKASEPLIPGEQFGIGGVASVRGLREREMSGDKGAFINLELHTPAWNGILPFFFYDAGWRKHVTPVAGLPSSDSASSVGVGARWTWEKAARGQRHGSPPC